MATVNNSSNTAAHVSLSPQAMELPGGMEHPVILHLYIHLMELSYDPIAASPAADVLRTKFPRASHLVHMASHIDIWGGHYKVTGLFRLRKYSQLCDLGTTVTAKAWRSSEVDQFRLKDSVP